MEKTPSCKDQQTGNRYKTLLEALLGTWRAGRWLHMLVKSRPVASHDGEIPSLDKGRATDTWTSLKLWHGQVSTLFPWWEQLRRGRAIFIWYHKKKQLKVKINRAKMAWDQCVQPPSPLPTPSLQGIHPQKIKQNKCFTCAIWIHFSMILALCWILSSLAPRIVLMTHLVTALNWVMVALTVGAKFLFSFLSLWDQMHPKQW